MIEVENKYKLTKKEYDKLYRTVEGELETLTDVIFNIKRADKGDGTKGFDFDRLRIKGFVESVEFENKSWDNGERVETNLPYTMILKNRIISRIGVDGEFGLMVDSIEVDGVQHYFAEIEALFEDYVDGALVRERIHEMAKDLGISNLDKQPSYLSIFIK